LRTVFRVSYLPEIHKMHIYNNRHPTAVLATLSLLTLTIGVGRAGAEPPRDSEISQRADRGFYTPPQQIVRFTDLDLSKPAGVQTLYWRVKVAARAVCRRGILSGDGRANTHFATCYEDTVNDAISRLNCPALTALHREKSSRVPARASLATQR
jgi:UrcA family protein